MGCVQGRLTARTNRTKRRVCLVDSGCVAADLRRTVGPVQVPPADDISRLLLVLLPKRQNTARSPIDGQIVSAKPGSSAILTSPNSAMQVLLGYPLVRCNQPGHSFVSGCLCSACLQLAALFFRRHFLCISLADPFPTLSVQASVPLHSWHGQDLVAL
jgi:hypothetical protein